MYQTFLGKKKPINGPMYQNYTKKKKDAEIITKNKAENKFRSMTTGVRESKMVDPV